MNWIDILLIVVALFSIWLGWEKGFIHATADLVTWIGSVLLAFFLYPYVTKLAERWFGSSPWILPLVFFVCLLATGSLLAFVCRLLLRNISDSLWNSRANHVFGILPGLVNGYIAASVVALLLLSIPFSDKVADETEKSRIARRLTPPAEWLQNKLSPVFDDAIRRSMTKLTVEPGSEETVRLPFTDTTVTERPDLEAEMLQLVNSERTQRGLKPLAADTALRSVAVAHSRDMFARGYFSHNTPEGKDPFDRMKKARVRYLVAGENLALARNLRLAHAGLMNSPGHRANILKPDYGRLGIGIVDGGRHGLMVSQEFRN